MSWWFILYSWDKIRLLTTVLALPSFEKNILWQFKMNLYLKFNAMSPVIIGFILKMKYQTRFCEKKEKLSLSDKWVMAVDKKVIEDNKC